MYTSVLCVGEGDRDARHKEHMPEGTCEAAGGDTHMVFGHYFPIFWAYKLSRRSSSGQLHRLHHPIFSPYAHLQKSFCQTGKISNDAFL